MRRADDLVQRAQAELDSCIDQLKIVAFGLPAFDQIMALTKGGPDSKTETVSYLIFQNGLGNGEYS